MKDSCILHSNLGFLCELLKPCLKHVVRVFEVPDCKEVHIQVIRGKFCVLEDFKRVAVDLLVNVEDSAHLPNLLLSSHFEDVFFLHLIHFFILELLDLALAESLHKRRNHVFEKYFTVEVLFENLMSRLSASQVHLILGLRYVSFELLLADSLPVKFKTISERRRYVQHQDVLELLLDSERVFADLVEGDAHLVNAFVNVDVLVDLRDLLHSTVVYVHVLLDTVVILMKFVQVNFQLVVLSSV